MTGWVTASRAKVSLTRRLGKSAPGHRRDDREVILLAQLGLEPGPEADVLVVLVDVDELPQLAVLVINALTEAGVLRLQGVQCLRHGPPVDFHHRLPRGQATKRPWDSHLDGHGWSPCVLS